MIEESSIENLKATIDIVDVISSYIELKKSGSNYKANCPFHSEKTPSFVVSPQKQIFHCFGCGAGGDAIKFIMEIEKLSYKEAIEKLASSYNIPLKYSKGQNSFIEEKRVLELMENWYIDNLKKNQYALSYLYNRGVDKRSVERFNLGYVESSRDVLNFLKANHIPYPIAIDAGVIAKGDNGELYARLTKRVIFPIYNASNSIVGFGGRTLNPNHPAKYINSPQTKLFDKSRLLYGYNLAKKEIFSKGKIIITEGYLDVIMLHQAGFINSVATLGTALTKQHLPLIKKGEPKVILAYDGDKAGVNAALKASKLLSSNSIEGRVVIFSDGVDPADMVANGEIETLKEILENGIDIVIFVIEQIANSFDLKNPHQKQKAIDEIKSYLNTLSPILQEEYSIEASKILGVNVSYFSNRKGSNIEKNSKIEIKDLAWESILKTLIDKKELIDDILNVVDFSFASDYEEAFRALVNGELNHPKLRGIEIDDKIPTLSEDELKKELIRELKRFYINKLKELPKAKNLDFRKKSYLIRKIKVDILPRLKQGELVEYESDFFI